MFQNILALFLISIRILPQKEGQDVPAIIHEIARVFNDYSTDVTFLNTFKVTGEGRVVAVVQVSNVTALDRLTATVTRLGPVDIECQPVIHFESFARNLGANKELTVVPAGILQKQSLYWNTVSFDYYGKTTEEYLELWKRESEIVLTLRNRGEFIGEFYKALAERIFYFFYNSPVPEETDFLFFPLPMTAENGANIHIQSKSVQFLDDYVINTLEEQTYYVS